MQTLTFLHGNHVPRCVARVDKRFDYFTLQLMTRGGVEVCYEKQCQTLNGLWLWSAFPGSHIRFHPAHPRGWWEHRYVAFQGNLVNSWKAAGLWFETPQAGSKAVIGIFDEMLAQMQRGDEWGARRAGNLLEQILLQLAEARTASLYDVPWLEPVLEQLNESGKFAPDYARLAAEHGLGLSTLRRRFKAATGVTLHNYVMQRRIARARQLLSETDWPLKAVASQLQFSDMYFFSAQFRRVTGVSPSAYRKSRQK